MRKGVQDVGQHQFLMLLLVIETDFHQRRDRPERILAGLMKEFHDGRVDMAAIGGDFLGAGAGQMAALVAGVPRSGADIVGIEQEGVIGVKRLVALAVFAEQELLEEPGGMGAVPFGRAGIRHRLDQLILRRQGAARRSVSFRTVRKASTRSWARLPESENNDGQGAASVAAADAGFVTMVSGWGENVALADGFPGTSVLDRGSRRG